MKTFPGAKQSRSAWLALYASVLLLPSGSSAAQESLQVIRRLPTSIYLPNQGGKVVEQQAVSMSGSEQPVIVKDLSQLTPANASPFKGALTKEAAQVAMNNILTKNSHALGIDGSAGTFEVARTRETLSGTYMDVEQRLNGLPIIGGGVQVKLSPDGSVQSMVLSVVSVPASKAASVPKNAILKEADATGIAWQDLGVGGEILEPPSVAQAYVAENNVLTLVYVVKLAVSKPFGYWEYQIDSSTGRIVSRKDRRIQEQKLAPTRGKSAQPSSEALSISYANELKRFRAQEKAQTSYVELAKKSDVKSAPGVVFMPNPISSLADVSLQDTDNEARFLPAYQSVTLEGLRAINGKLHLTGDLVQVLDFEPGEGNAHRPASTSVDGWTAHRGDNAFNDVMVYFHIARNLNYLRSLGYSGNRDLFPGGIAVDSDGVNGDDNSHFVPSSDRLAFGHGCVDDNEDTDVILHELGHAIHTHINPSWGGGDSEAIGEGFGDYWAVSQRMRMTNGSVVQSGKVFIWDGIDACWPGRRVDRAGIKYDPLLIYDAHQRMNGFVSDELWSTPLVSSLNELMIAGESAESVDIVILEGMAAAGANFTMRSLATTTVEQARKLFPGKPHATIFEKNFKSLGILN